MILFSNSSIIEYAIVHPASANYNIFTPVTYGNQIFLVVIGENGRKNVDISLKHYLDGTFHGIGKDETTLKKARDKLVKITEKVIADAQAVQAELELLQEKLPLAKGLLRQMGEWIEVASTGFSVNPNDTTSAINNAAANHLQKVL